MLESRTVPMLLVVMGGFVAPQVVPMSAADADTASLSCGATVTTSVTLQADLIGCPGDGLLINADAVTIDLNGHTIAGDALPPAFGFEGGIVIRGQHDVVVTGGSIRGFDAGVVVEGSSGTDIRSLDSSDNVRSGVALFSTSRSRVTDVTTRDNADHGFLVAQGASATLARVVATGNQHGVTFGQSDDNELRHSLVSGNADNVVVYGSRNLIVDNVVTNATGCGVDCGGYGISHEGGSDNVISGNRVVGALRDGIRVSNFGGDLETERNVIERNTVVDARGDGVAVATDGDGPVRTSVLHMNSVIRARHNGIHVATPSTEVRRNRVIANGRSGISAVPGVRDGGGNRARANAQEPQCLNVLCQ